PHCRCCAERTIAKTHTAKTPMAIPSTWRSWKPSAIGTRLAFPATAGHHHDDAVVLAPVVRAVHADGVRTRGAHVLRIEPRREVLVLGERRAAHIRRHPGKGATSAGSRAEPVAPTSTLLVLPGTRLQKKI